MALSVVGYWGLSTGLEHFCNIEENQLYFRPMQLVFLSIADKWNWYTYSPKKVMDTNLFYPVYYVKLYLKDTINIDISSDKKVSLYYRYTFVGTGMK